MRQHKARDEMVYFDYRTTPGASFATVAKRHGLTRGQVSNIIHRERAREEAQQLEEKEANQRQHKHGTDDIVNAIKESPSMQRESKHNLSNIQVRPGGGRIYPRQEFRAAVFDIETTDFTATGNVGNLICCSILPLDSDAPHSHYIGFGHNHGQGDKELLEAVLNDLSQYDLLIGHYVLGFDLPWLQTRADHYGLPTLRRWLIFDTYNAARIQQIRSQRKSLAFLLDHFGLENLKTSIYPRLWDDIRSPNRETFEYSRGQIVEHCELDVIANRMLFDRLMPRAYAFTANPFKLTRWASAP